MPEFFIDGRAVHADPGQTVIQAARAAGIDIPVMCWHPALSVAGNCRVCMVEVEGERGGRNWLDIACNMPVADGMKVLTGTPAVQQRRREVLQLMLLNHPVDCGVCDKAGECMLQDEHVAYNNQPSVSLEPKVKATKFFDLSPRIVLDNERCIVCSRCVRFTREVSKSHGLAIAGRGDESLIRPAADGSFAHDHYSDNVVDLCPVGALLSRQFMYQARVWYLEATPSVCPGCARGCTVQLWHRKPEWALRALDTRANTAIVRITPLDNPQVNGPWICNTGRDAAQLLERPRPAGPLLRGRGASAGEALAMARTLLQHARRPLALVSSWASNEELDAFRDTLAARFECRVRADRQAAPGEPEADDFLICADKNPNGTGARLRFGAGAAAVPADTDVVLAWGADIDLAALPAGVPVIVLTPFADAASADADVCVPITLQTERHGHYTNVDGVTSAFAPCRQAPAGSVHAAVWFAQLATALGAASVVPAHAGTHLPGNPATP